MKNIHLHFGFFAILLGAANMMGSVGGGSMGTPGLFANVLAFDPAKLVAQESQNLDLTAPVFF